MNLDAVVGSSPVLETREVQKKRVMQPYFGKTPCHVEVRRVSFDHIQYLIINCFITNNTSASWRKFSCLFSVGFPLKRGGIVTSSLTNLQPTFGWRETYRPIIRQIIGA